jgi:tetratricopeptide (TPR) repeat protein
VAQGDSRDSQDNRRADGGHRSDRDNNRNRRPDNRDGRGPRQSDRRGGYQGNRRNDDDRRGGFNRDRRDGDDRRGGYQGNRRNDDDRRGGYQGNRRDDDRRGGYQGNRRNDDDRRGGYGQNRRDGDYRRGGFNRDRRDGDDRRGGYQGNRRNDDDRRGGFNRDRRDGDDRRGGYQGNRRNDDDRRGGYRGNRRDDNRGGRGGYGRNDNDRRASRKTDTGDYAREQRARRPRIQEPEIPEGVTGRELDKEISSQLRSLDKENADMVAKHLVAAGGLLDLDPERAHEHAKAAMARAGRVAVVREALGIAAYYVENYDEAVRELRTHRRISGSNDNIALIADAERGRGKPEKAIELLKNAEELDLDNDTRTELVIVAAGAKSDLDDIAGARRLIEAEDFTQKPGGGLVRLMAAYAEVLRIDGETELADKYEELSRRTAKATGTLFGDEEPDLNAGVEIETVEEVEDEPEAAGAETSEGADAPAEDAEAEDDTAAPAAAPKSKTHVSAKELKSVKVTDDEIEAELDEILAEADADAGSEAEADAGSEPDTTAAEADGEQ